METDDQDATHAVHVGRHPGRGWVRVSHGLQRHPATPDVTAWQSLLPTSAAFSHLTAARLHGWWLPELPADLPVLVDQPRDQARSRRAGLRVTRTARDVPTVALDGVRVTAPAATLLACARDLALLDLVVLVDAALRAGCTAQDVAAAAAHRSRGAPLLRRALAMADPRSESPWETLLRVLHVSVGATVVPQHVVTSADGRFVARGDLWLPGTRVLHEYDGGVHRSARAHAGDLRRDRALIAAGWTRRGYVAADLCRRPAEVLRDIDAALGRPHRPARLRAWLTLLHASTLTPQGRARLRARLPA
ncbi:hypothetical protein [Cellulomonas dongxiuzhuiae]|uniref:hypothetical protein n=1 Tax=Cellulomonas dongxiuzhuiae TaxID=2819979 RepID=UPI001AAE5108|nr:hypothetical protein [Cellulomonas dongxiuzhuiae]MBO3088314.1 hypothetical protein [Cellulomonas dongxiuzhuiae]